MQGGKPLQVLTPTSVELNMGELTFIVGPSGSGKSTLLQLMGGLDSPDGGHIEIKEHNIQKMNDKKLSQFRRRHLGFVFQFFNLLNNLNAIENVALPLILDNIPWDKAREKAEELLVELGLEDRIHHYPHQLSGGQLQRIAISRALVNDPFLVLADEPTGNLDSKTAQEMMELFQNLIEKKKYTMVMVTHDLGLAKFGHRKITIRDGMIEQDQRVK